MNSRRWTLVALGAVSLLGGAKVAKPTAEATNWAPPVADSGYHVRSTFDADPSALLGRFLPPGTDVDDGAAMVTRCSQYVTAREVPAGGTYDVLAQASSSAAAAFGFPPVSVGGESRRDQVVRIRYHLTKKLQYVVADPDGWRRCCAQGPGLCEEQFVSEFVAGDGELFFAVGKESSVGADAGARGAVGHLEAHGGTLWQQATTLDGMYFAFKTARMPLEAPLPTGDCDTVAWDDVPPRSADGLYLVGVSPRADSEVDARTAARADARTQVLEQCKGVTIECGGATHEATGVAEGARTSSTSSEVDCVVTSAGRVRSLEARASCVDHEDTPMGRGAWLVKSAYFLEGGCPSL